MAWWKNVKTWKSQKPKAKASLPSPVPLQIGIDANTPPGHNWAYNAYFPETNVSVPKGNVVDFHFNPNASPDSLHTVTFLNSGQTADQFRTANPLIVADNTPPDLVTEGTIGNGNIFGPSFPGPTHAPCGFGAPLLPCTWDNTPATGNVSSGQLSTSSTSPTDFFVTINAPAGATYTYICAIHKGMQGTITVTATVGGAATTQAEADAASAAQYTALNTAAAPVETADLTPAPPVVHGDGTKTWTQKLGDEVGDVEFLEMLPPTLPIAKGDSVTFVNSTTAEVHTATFATGSPFGNPVCEGPSGMPDIALNTGPGPACTPPPTFEQPLNVSQLGEKTTISSGFTAGSTGVLGNFPSSGITSTSYTYKFPSNGTFGYFCAIHGAAMFGAIYTPHYRETASDGGQFTFGGADFFGSEGNLNLTLPVVGGAETFDSQGYWHVASDGGVFAHGDAPFFGSMGGQFLAKPMVAIADMPGQSSDGYSTVASDGGVFSFGGARFFGSMGGKFLAAPIVGIAATPDGGGYWEVASDGGVFAFGDAQFFGSMGGQPLAKPIVGISPNGFFGYTMVASDGGVFNFGDASFFGSMGGRFLAQPIVGITLTIDGQGYNEAASDGGVFSFGNAKFFGSMGGRHLNKPMVSINGV